MRTLVVGLGNERRGDDVVGLAVARRLASTLAGRAEVRAHPGEPVDLIPWWAGRDLVVLIDAAKGWKDTGRIQRYEHGRDVLPGAKLGTSSHAFDLRVAVELAASLDALPARLVLYVVEGTRFGFGDAPSYEVMDAVERVAAQVDAEVGALGATPERA